MYYANEETPTCELRFVEKPEPVYGFDKDGNPIGVGSRPARVLQQKWEVRENYETREEWRDVPLVHDAT